MLQRLWYPRMEMRLWGPVRAPVDGNLDPSCPYASRNCHHFSECLDFTVEKNPTVKNPYKKLLQKNWLMTLLAALLVFLMVLFMKEAWEVF